MLTNIARALFQRSGKLDISDSTLSQSKNPTEVLVSQYLKASNTPRLHFGCGGHNFQGWLNLDREGAADIFCDFEGSLSFLPDQSFELCYSEHVLEHFNLSTGLRILTDLYRCLRPGGTIRLALPDLDFVIGTYLNFKKEQWSYLFDCDERERSKSLETRGEFINLSFHGWGHQYLYNQEDLEKILYTVGFVGVTRMQYRQSEIRYFSGIETRPEFESSLIIEAKKPRLIKSR